MYPIKVSRIVEQFMNVIKGQSHWNCTLLL